MFFLRNRFNPNLFRYRSSEDRGKHQSEMDENGFEIYREWEEKGIGDRTYYYCEYKEIGKA